MKVNELMARLAELDREGFGNRRVIDDGGNDVMGAVRPVSEHEAVGADPDASAVMLYCYVDYGRNA